MTKGWGEGVGKGGRVIKRRGGNEEEGEGGRELRKS